MNIQHLEVAQGEDRVLTVYARDSNNAVVNLTGKTVAFYIGKSPWHPESSWVLITKTGTVTDASGGVFTVPIANADTKWRAGDYAHVTKTTDGSGNISAVCQGRFRITSSLVP